MRNQSVVPQPGILAAIVGAAAVATEVAAALAFSHLLLGMAFVLHMASSLGLGLSLLWMFRPSGVPKARFWCTFSFLMALFAPGYGMIVIALLLFSLRFFPPPPGDLLSEFVEHVAPRETGDASSRHMRAGDIPLVDHLQVEPLIDMLQTEDVDLKRAVIDAMARRRGSKLIQCIQGCLQDPRPEIYQYAMARLGRLQEDFTRDIARATQDVEKAPEATEPHMRLARVFEQYLDSGLVDATLVDFYQGQLLREYEAVLKVNPDETAASLARGRVLIELRRAHEAAAEYQRVLSRDGANIEARFGMVQVHYASKSWYAMQFEVDDVLRLCATRQVSNPEMLELVQWLRGQTEDSEIPSTEQVLEQAPPAPVGRAKLQVPKTRLQLPSVKSHKSMSTPTLAVRSGTVPGLFTTASGSVVSGADIMAAVTAGRRPNPPAGGAGRPGEPVMPPPSRPPTAPPDDTPRATPPVAQGPGMPGPTAAGEGSQQALSGWRSRLQKRIASSTPPSEGPP